MYNLNENKYIFLCITSIYKVHKSVYNNLTRSNKTPNKTTTQGGATNMRNEFKTTLQVKRINICDLMLACLAAKELANDDGKKWVRLHDELKKTIKRIRCTT